MQVTRTTFLLDDNYLTFSLKGYSINDTHEQLLLGEQDFFPLKASKVSVFDVDNNCKLYTQWSIKEDITIFEYYFNTPLLPKSKKELLVTIHVPLENLPYECGGVRYFNWLGDLDEIIVRNNHLFTISLPVKKIEDAKGIQRYKLIHKKRKYLSFIPQKEGVRVEIGNKAKYKIAIIAKVFSSKEIPYAKISFVGLRNSYYQNVKIINAKEGMKIEFDKNKNTIHIWEQPLKSGLNFFNVSYEVERKACFLHHTFLGTLNDMKRAPKNLLALSSIWDYHPEMHRILKKIISGYTDVFEIFTKLTSFVIRRTRYKIVEGRQPASKTWEVKYGDCSEVTDLLVSLLRQAGIPCSRASGWVITDNGKLEKHAWLEIYTPQGTYQPLDPTWGFVNGISSQHILQFNEYSSHIDSIINIEWFDRTNRAQLDLSLDAKMLK